MEIKTVAAGILPFYDNGKTILLGKEYRKAYGVYNWMEFCGKQELGESLAETAHREAMEESAGMLDITINDVLNAESNGHYIDHFNEKSGVFCRMYCVKVLSDKFDVNDFCLHAEGKKDVEKVALRFF